MLVTGILILMVISFIVFGFTYVPHREREEPWNLRDVEDQSDVLKQDVEIESVRERGTFGDKATVRERVPILTDNKDLQNLFDDMFDFDDANDN